MKLVSLVVAVPALLVTSCSSTLSVKPYPKQAAAQTGIVHALPMTQFEIKITRRIAKCIAKSGTGKDLKPAEMKVATTFDVVERSIEDSAARFVIDPGSLSTTFNSAGVEITFHENTRMLKSINATVKDEAGPALVSAIKIAGAAMGVPGGFSGAPEHVCNVKNEIPEKVKAANEGLAELKTRTKTLNDEKAQLTKLIADYDGIVDASDPGLDSNIMTKIKDVQKAQAAVATQTALVADLLKPISDTTDPIYWPMSGGERGRTSAYELPEKVLKEWVGDPTGEQKRSVSVFFRLEADSTANGTDSKGVDSLSKIEGIAYRTPQPARLVFEKLQNSKPSSFDLNNDAQFEEIDDHKATVAQLGFINKLIISADPFESVEYTIEFTDKGYLSKAGYKQIAAPISSVMSASEALTGQILALEAAREAEAQSELDKTLKRLQAEVAIKEAEAKLNPPAPTDSQETINMLSADTLEKQARIANIEATIKLTELGVE